MKKNLKIFILTLCFIMTSSSVLANCNCSPTCNCNKNTQKPKFSPYHPGPVLTEDMKSYRYLSEQIKKERMAISNALSLTEEQAKCRVDLMKENSVKINEKLKQLYDENCKLKVLEAQNASRQVICEQKKNIKCVKNQLEEIIQNENREFKKILTREQRSKLSMIQKLERKSVEDCKHQKNYYKSNPKMRPFACPKRPVCDCQNKV